MEKIDILVPPNFDKSGEIKTLEQAWEDQDWIGTFNLWIVQSEPVPTIVYQQRSPNSSWEPGKLDITAGGHYKAGENIFDGLREAKEELGKDYKKNALVYIGRKLHVSYDIKKRLRQNVLHVFLVLDNSPLESYRLQESEVHAIFICPLDKLIKVHTKKNYSFAAQGINNKGIKTKIKVTKNSFPFNWDNYHLKIALLAQRFLNDEENLIY